MGKLLLVQPWNYHDEGIKTHDLSQEWRNGPYSLLLLGTILRKHGHKVIVLDLGRELVMARGNTSACLGRLSDTIQEFKPDIIGFSFFSIHFFETQKAVLTARKACERIGIHPIFIAGGIHASIEPKATISQLGFDYAFVGAADSGIVQLAEGVKPENIQGIIAPGATNIIKGEETTNLDSLPFLDWSLCDYAFYAHPTYARLKIRQSNGLDMMMGRGCVYKCAFCAYSALCSVSYYSAMYLIEQMEFMSRNYKVNGIYFIDSTIGNNRPLLTEFCELMIKKDIVSRVEWYANIRVNQVNEELLKLMWQAGCRYLFYGFESGSQRVLDLMNKKTTVEENYKAAELHNKLKFPYNASILLGYPGEREEDILQTLEFIRKTQPPSIGINSYVPLPGSTDYDNMKKHGIIKTDDPMEWRRIGEISSTRVYADVPENRYHKLFAQAQKLAYVDIPKIANPAWGYKVPIQKRIRALKNSLLSKASSIFRPKV